MPLKIGTLPKDEKGNDPNDHKDDKDYLEKIEMEPTALQRLLKLSATNRINEMEANLKNDVYIFPDIALSGQITLFYAWPNTGKTIFFLKFLRDAITQGLIQSEDVIYINADDSYQGLFAKTKLAKVYGFNMISPNEAGVTHQQILEISTSYVRFFRS